MEMCIPSTVGRFILDKAVVVVESDCALGEEETDDEYAEDLVEVDELCADGEVQTYGGCSDD